MFKIKRGLLFPLVLVSVCLLYFGSLYTVSAPSRECVQYADEVIELNIVKDIPIVSDIEQEASTETNENVVLENEEKSTMSPVNTFVEPVIEYTTVDVKPACTSSFLKSEKKEKAVIVVLVRNNELPAMRRTLRQFEDRFNRKYNYDYVFLNEVPFTEEFKSSVSALTNAKVKFGLVPESMWSIPDNVNQTVMYRALEDYSARNVMYGGSLSYRHMCRFNSGFFYRHPLLKEYDFYWRVEPGVSFFCDLDYDPFKFMRENNKEYGFTITLKEIPETIPTLWEHTMKFAQEKQLNTTLLKFFGNPDDGYNLCHFWSNFEIASLNLWRGEQYQSYFDYLDSTGNFFYERWGDAIVHSLAAGMFLNKSQVHFFDDIGYQHDNFAHCVDDGIHGKCMCPENVPNFDNVWGSCLPQWKEYKEEGERWDFKKVEETPKDDSLNIAEQKIENDEITKKPDSVDN